MIDWWAEVRKLAHKHKLGFRIKEVGGEFNRHDLGKCRVGAEDPKEDYDALVNWLKQKGVEP